MWDIEGSDTNYGRQWSIVTDPVEEPHKDGVTWNVMQEIEISTSRHNCPAIDIICTGTNYYGEYIRRRVLDVLGEFC